MVLWGLLFGIFGSKKWNGTRFQKRKLKVPFSISKNSIIFNDLLEWAFEHKSEKFFCLQIFLKIFENFWKFLKIFILSKKEFDSLLSYNCNLYLKKVLIYEITFKKRVWFNSKYKFFILRNSYHHINYLTRKASHHS